MSRYFLNSSREQMSKHFGIKIKSLREEQAEGRGSSVGHNRQLPTQSGLKHAWEEELNSAAFYAKVHSPIIKRPTDQENKSLLYKISKKGIKVNHPERSHSCLNFSKSKTKCIVSSSVTQTRPRCVCVYVTASTNFDLANFDSLPFTHYIHLTLQVLCFVWFFTLRKLVVV